jgi:N-acetylneuraminic acid mutarotase
MIKYLLILFLFLPFCFIQAQVTSKNVRVISENIVNQRAINLNGSSLNPPKSNDVVNSILAFLFVEFEDRTFPPVGWQLEYTGTKFWFLDTLVSGYGIGSGSAKFESYNAVEGTAQSLISAGFLPAVLGDSLKFDNAYAPYSASGAPDDQFEISYSKDGGASWNLLVLLHGGSAGELVSAPPTSAYFIPTASQWITHRFALPQGTNRLKFKAISAYGNNIYLDNIKVGSQPANDAGVVSIDMASGYQLVKIVPKVTVRNYGTSTPSVFNVKLEITPGTYASVKQITNLTPLAFSQVSFDDWTPAIGSYNVKVFTQLVSDGNPSNDTLAAKVIVSNTGWLTAPVIPMPTFLGSGCAMSFNGKPLFFSMGGVTNSTLGTEVNKLNLIDSSWTFCAPVPKQRLVMASASLNGKIYLIGGAENPSSPVYQNTIYIYDIASNIWSKNSVQLPLSLGWCKAASYQDSLIYIVGGYDGSYPINRVLLFNVKTNTVRDCTPLPNMLFGGAMAISGNSIVYIGGVGANDEISASTYVGQISQSDKTQITWNQKTDYPSGKRFRWDAAAWINNCVIVSGGCKTLDWYTTPESYFYDVAADKWTQLETKPTSVFASSVGSVILPNNSWRFIVSSGFRGGSYGTETTEIYYNNDNVPSSVKSDLVPILGFELAQNYPNPFNPSTIIKYSVPEDGYVKLSVYNILGKEVSALVNNWQRSGSYSVMFNARDLSSGVYFYKLESGPFNATKKLIVIK